VSGRGGIVSDDLEATDSEPTADFELPGSVICAIGAETRFDGLLSYWGAARIEGMLHGEVAAQGLLEVGPEARVAARVEVDVLVVEGVLEGEVVARERLEVMPGARVRARVRTPRLALADGAVFEGQLDMGRADGEPPSRGAQAASAA
jgi:cytoskeletal protein CcmA (bactofilin family)